ncbi:MAG: hypothetical protein IJ400_02880 [Clostridia bacterium]|nr:hypothetical protein [Clostridia bacterium]
MKQTHKLFKLFLPIIIGFTLLATLLGIFMLAFNYTDEQGIYFKAAAPLLFFAFILITIGLSIFFVCKVDHVYIVKTKHDCPFFQFASVFAFLVIFALTIYDLATFLQYQTLDTARVFKILRLIASVPFLGHLLLSVFPKRIRRQKIEIPKWLRVVCSISAIVWCLFGLLAVWFYESQGYTYFKVTHIVFYTLMTLYFLFDAKNQLIKPCSKLLILSSLFLFITSASFALSTIFGIVIGKVVSMQPIGISEFELICSFAFSLYALSKVFAYMTTLKFAIDTSTTHYFAKRKHKKNTTDSAEE